MEHHEPIVLIGIPEAKITKVIEHFRGADVRGMAAGTSQISSPDIVCGATVTVLVIGDSIVRSALKMVEAKGLGAAAAAASAPEVVAIDTTKTAIEDWQALVGDGSVRRLYLSVSDINQAYEKSGNAQAAQRPEKGSPDEETSTRACPKTLRDISPKECSARAGCPSSAYRRPPRANRNRPKSQPWGTSGSGA